MGVWVNEKTSTVGTKLYPIEVDERKRDRERSGVKGVSKLCRWMAHSSKTE